MNYGMIVRVLGNLILIEAAAMSIPLGISIYYNSGDARAFMVTILFMSAIGLLLSRLRAKKRYLKAKDAVTIVTFGWFIISFFGALPFVLSGSLPTFTDAFFEAVSGLTTTGATVISNVEIIPKGIIFWRSFMHWMGGMGILVLTLAIMPSIGVGSFQIFKAETPGPVTDKIVPKMKDTAKILYTVYLGITIIETVLLLIGGMNLFDALIHTFGTVGTGGFSNYNASIGHFNSNYIYFIVSLFMVGSGVNLALYYDLYKGNFKNILANTEFKIYLLIVSAATLLVFANIFGTYDSIGDTLNHAFFQVSSIITTTGYSTTDFDLWPDFSKSVLFMMMFVGGSAGSTAGSIKVIRLVILFKLVRREISKILHPRAILPIQVAGKRLSSDVVASVSGFFFLYLLIFLMGTLLISLENVGLVSAASAVAATLGNIGPGFDFVGPTKTYALFSDFSKWILSFLMLFGRLELFTFFLMLTPSFWKKV